MSTMPNGAYAHFSGTVRSAAPDHTNRSAPVMALAAPVDARQLSRCDFEAQLALLVGRMNHPAPQVDANKRDTTHGGNSTSSIDTRPCKRRAAPSMRGSSPVRTTRRSSPSSLAGGGDDGPPSVALLGGSPWPLAQRNVDRGAVRAVERATR